MFSVVHAVLQVHRTSFYLGIPRLSRLVIKRFVRGVRTISLSYLCRYYRGVIKRDEAGHV